MQESFSASSPIRHTNSTTKFGIDNGLIPPTSSRPIHQFNENILLYSLVDDARAMEYFTEKPLHPVMLKPYLHPEALQESLLQQRIYRLSSENTICNVTVG